MRIVAKTTLWLLAVFVLRATGAGILTLLVLLALALCLGTLTANSANIEVVPPHREGGTLRQLRWGVAAVQGRRAYMEDMHQVRDLVPALPPTSRVPDGTPQQSHAPAQRLHSDLTHFFGVYDGHGGKRAAAFVREHLVDNLLHQLQLQSSNELREGDKPLDAAAVSSTEAERRVRRACSRAWLATDGAFLTYAARNAFPDGSTAVCCLVQSDPVALQPARLLVANVGDSRCAVVRSDGSALALSDDHKPNRPDERERVVASGGQVVFAGCWRVQGDLAVSRAFGDVHLKRYGVSAEPEITSYSLLPSDAFVVLASDGLWDVIDELACARVVLASAGDTVQAANALCELALASGSMDNVTALVVDLRRVRPAADVERASALRKSARASVAAARSSL